MEREDRWAAGMIRDADQGSWGVAVLTTVFALVACWLIALQANPVTAVSRHWFYVPVVFASVRFGIPGALMTGTAAGILGGPLAGGLATLSVDPAIWGTRAAFFLGVGLVVASAVAALRRAYGRTLELAHRETELAAHQATFIQTISHEFRTPLTVLRGGIMTLDQQADRVDSVLRPLVHSMRRAEQRLDEMVSVVLATAEASDASKRLETEPVSIASVVSDVVGALDERRNARQRVRHDLETVVDTSSAYLRVILQTIVDNALRFSPADEPVEITASQAKDRVTIAVRDFGPGMHDRVLATAFDPFVQGDGSSRRNYDGLGLGLFTARRLAQRLGGTVNAKQEDQGLTVTIELPQHGEIAHPTSRGRRTWRSGVMRRFELQDEMQPS